MKINPLKRLRLLSTFCVLFAVSPAVVAQVSGVKSIPADYASIDAFITDINTNGIGTGGVTLNVPSGYTETAPATGFAITATGTVSDPVLLIGQGPTQPVITASASLTVGALNDGIFRIMGGDYITIQGFTILENAANTTTTAGSNTMTEWGIALLYLNTTDAPQNCSILNNTIQLGATYQNAAGIYANVTHSFAAPTTTASATGANGGIHNLKIYGNTISSVNMPIVVVGPSAAADHSTGLDIGGSSPATGNTITSFGLTGTFSSYPNVSGSVNGIYLKNNKAFLIAYNSVTNTGTNTAGIARGIYVVAPTNNTTGTYTSTVRNNTISITSGANSAVYGIHMDANAVNSNSELVISNNTMNAVRHSGAIASPTSALNIIYNASATGKTTISGNNFNNLGTVATSSDVYFIYNTNTGTQNSITGNTTTGTFEKTGSGGTIYGYYNNGSPTSGKTVFSGNTFSNITINGSTSFNGTYFNTATTHVDSVYNNTISNIVANTGATGAITGLYQSYGGPLSAVYNNTVTTITGGTGTTYGMRIGSTASASITVFGNTISGISNTGSSDVIGLLISGSANSRVYSNKVYNITKNNASGYAAGITVSSGSNLQLYNNLISDIKSPLANTGDAVRGINIASSSTSATYGVYNNTVYLNATSSGTNFGTTALYHTGSTTATTAQLDLRGNILINLSTPNGTGIISAYRRSSANLANFGSNSNKNLLYAGTPDATHVILYDGTTAQQTIANYMTLVAPRELQSITGEGYAYGTPGAFFISLIGSNSDFLRPVAGLTTQVESGAPAITTPINVSTDYAGTVRATFAGYAGTGTNPDMGAYEFEGTSPAPVITLNSVTPPASVQCTAAGRLVSVTVTTFSGSIVTASIGYTVNGVPQSGISMTNTSGNIWEGTIPVPTPANATISWGVSATNSLGITSTMAGTSYADEPLTGATGSIAMSVPSPMCAGDNNTLTATIARPPVTLGGGALATTGSATSSTNYVSPFNYYFGGYKAQYVVRASELTGAGISAGQLTSLAFDVTSAPGVTYTGFNLSIAPTASTTASGTFITGTFTDVYSGNLTVGTTGLFTIPFTIPFNWDGTSNIVVQLCWSNNNTGGSSTAEVRYDPTTFVSLAYFRVDSSTPATVCGTTTATNTLSSRPKMVFGNNIALNSISWSDGVSTVGTSNPLAVSPTTTTTYTASIIASGCPLSPSPSATITVNPLPAAPTAVNSAQCGTQVPTANVTSTSGLPTPTFVWYSAASGGTAMQTNASTTYLSTVASTTTFYVAEKNATTGCESVRTPVTVTVSAADAVSATASLATICLGSTVTLDAANTNPTPNQSYAYSWISTTGSGNETSTAGSSIVVTPTSTGVYTYDLTAVDGGCSAIASAQVTVHPAQPTATAGASLAAVCIGGTVNLTSSASGMTSTPLAENFDSGLGSWTTQYSGTASATTGWAVQNAPYSYSTYFTNFATPQGGGFAMSNADLGASGLKTRAKLISPTFSTVGMLDATLTFENLYRRWTSGDSLVAVEISINGGTTWSQLKVYTTSQGVTTDGAQVPAMESIPLGAGYLNQANVKIRFNYVSTWGYYWIVDNVKITGSTASFAWTSSPSGFTSAVPNPTGVSPTVTTTYTVTATNQYGCASSASTMVTVNSLPVVDAGIDQTVCSGTSVTLSGSGATSYSWNNGVTNNTAFTASATTTYTVTGTDGNGCSNTDNVLVTVNALPSVNAGADQAVCSGENVTLAGSGAISYSWNNGINDNTAFTPTATTTYTVTGTDGNGCTNTDNVLVTVNALPMVSAGIDQTVCENDQVTLMGSGATSYNWDNGVTDNTAFAATATTTYTVIGTDANGCENTDDVTVIVNTLPVVDAGVDQTVCEGDQVTLSGTGASSYAWDNGQVDGVPFTASATTTFTVIGTDANGCSGSDDVILTVNPTPTVDAGADQMICDGGQVTLTGSGASTYDWDNSVIDGAAFTPTATTTYTVTGTDANGCSSTDAVTVTVNALPAVNAGADQTICDGDAVTLNGSGATTYNWDNGVTNGVSFMPSATTTYTVTGTDANGCSNTDDVTVNVNANPVAVATDNGDATLTASAGTSYQWIDCATNLPINGENSQTFVPTQNGNYAVTVTNSSGCSATSACVFIGNVGVKEMTADAIQVYPNPTAGDITIIVPVATAQLEVIDAQGKLIIRSSIQSGETISISGYDRGVYMLKVTTEQGTSLHRVVKN